MGGVKNLIEKFANIWKKMQFETPIEVHTAGPSFNLLRSKSKGIKFHSQSRFLEISYEPIS